VHSVSWLPFTASPRLFAPHLLVQGWLIERPDSSGSPRLLAVVLTGDHGIQRLSLIQLPPLVDVSDKVRHRYMDPTLGRFTQVDPARDGSNWYAYCGSDPVNRTDPMGLYAINADGTAVVQPGDKGYWDLWRQLGNSP